MRFKAKKVYGNSKQLNCPFCARIATHKSKQGLDVCRLHIKETLEEIKCVCGGWLESKVGKFGPYFNCLNCGNISYSKGMEIKSMTMKEKPAGNKVSEGSRTEPKEVEKKKVVAKDPEGKEITISTDDVWYFS